MAKNPLSAEQESQVVGYVTGFATEIVNTTQRLRDTWLQVYKNYRIFKAEGKKAWQSKLWIPKTFTAIEQIASRTTAHNPKFNLRALQSSALQYFTANQEEIDEAIATNGAIDEGNSELTPMVAPEPDVKSSRDILDAYLNYVFTEQKLKQKIRVWDKGRLIYGKYHVKISTDVLTELKETERETEEGTEMIEEEVFKNILPDIETVDVFDLLIHPFEESVDKAYGLIHKKDETSINELDDETYFNLDLLDKDREYTGEELDSDQVEKRNVIAQDTQTKINKNAFATKEYHGRYSLTGDPKDEKEYIITIAADSTLIRFEENKLKDANGRTVRPFVAMGNQPVPGEYYDIGDAEPIMSLQEEMNSLRNQRQDFNNSVLYPEWMVRKGSGINPFQLVHKPNNIIQVDDMNSLQPVPKDSVPQSSYNEETALNRDIQDTTSTTSFAQPGASSAFTDTLGGAAIRQEEQNTRMKLKIEYLDDAVSELGKKILLIIANEVEDHVEIPDDDDFHTIYKDTFKKMAEGFSPVVVSGSMSADTPMEKRNQAIARGNISMQYAQAGVPVNLEKSYKDIMEEGFEVKDVDSLISNQPVGVPEQGQPQETKPLQ